MARLLQMFVFIFAFPVAFRRTHDLISNMIRTQMLHVWYIYLHLGDFEANAGKYSIHGASGVWIYLHLQWSSIGIHHPHESGQVMSTSRYCGCEILQQLRTVVNLVEWFIDVLCLSKIVMAEIEYPLVNLQKKLLKMTIEIVDLPI